MKKNLLQIALLMLFLFCININAQAPTVNPGYMMILANDAQVAPNEYEFDIILMHTTDGGTPFILQGAQVGLLFNNKIKNGGTLTAIYIPGTSDFISAQVPANPSLIAMSGTAADTGVFRVAPKVTIDTSVGTNIPLTGLRMGRFKISTTAPYFTPGEKADLRWNFLTGSNRYPTKIAAWVNDGTGTVIAKEITVSSSHKNDALNNLPLPVELNTLTVTAEGRDVSINWETKSESNTSKFEVERTTAGVNNWVKVGEVAASGNSNSPKKYSYVDKKLNSGKYNYRLKMVDVDGSCSYSNTVEAEVSLPKEYAISQNYPNPFNPTTRIDYQLPFDSKVTLEIYGITGEKVATIINSELAAGYYTADINAAALNLASGMYIYRMSATNQAGQNFTQVKKFMLMK